MRFKASRVLLTSLLFAATVTAVTPATAWESGYYGYRGDTAYTSYRPRYRQSYRPSYRQEYCPPGYRTSGYRANRRTYRYRDGGYDGGYRANSYRTYREPYRYRDRYNGDYDRPYQSYPVRTYRW